MRTIVFVILSVVCAITVSGQQPSQQASAAEAMLAAGRPGEEHTLLASLAGDWQREVTFTLGGAQSMKASGSARNRMILGGRFLQSEQMTAMPATPQMPALSMETLTIYGFDRRVKQFTIVEFDSTGTYSVAGAGSREPAGRIVMAGETLDDHGGARTLRRYDMVLRIVDRDTYVTQVVFKFPDREPLPIVTATHRRTTR